MPQSWTLNRPGPLVARGPDLWTVDDSVPGRDAIPRRMTLCRRDDGLLFFNAIPVADEVLAAIRALGPPRALIVPNPFHALDAAPFIEKLGVKAFASPATCTALGSRVACAPLEELPVDARTRLFTVSGFWTQETVLSFDGSLIVADLLTNLSHQRGLSGWLMRLVGFTGPAPRLPKPVRLRVMRDGRAVRALLEQLADLSPSRLVPSHGDLFEGDVAAALRRVASSL